MDLSAASLPERLTPYMRLSTLAGSRPEQLSIIDGDRELTASEVFERAISIAAMILDREPAGGPPIAVIAGSMLDQILGALGVLLAGRGFSTIETRTPIARSHEMVGRLGSTIALVDTTQHATLVPEGCSPILFSASPGLGGEIAIPTPDPKAPACVVFTSGSTGRPKAVVYRFATIEARIAQRKLELDDVEREVRPANSLIAFAGGVVSIYEVLLGETIALFDVSGQGPKSFIDWVDGRGFSSIKMVPSLVRSLEPYMAGRRMERLRSIRTAGEGLHWSDIGLMRQIAAPDLTVEAYYGSTEAGNALFNIVGPTVPLGEGPVPLGAPVPARDIRLEPIGPRSDDPLELVVVGRGVADGYLGEPELTAKRFFVTDDGQKAYRTGDLLARDARGELYHRGRVDDLVKIRGLLVEPAEPERVLRTVPGLAAATVLAQPTPSGAMRLVAHVATTTEDPATPATVRRALTDQLPRHLVPAVLVRHETLPLTDRGKVDRDRLRGVPLEPWRAVPIEPPTGEIEPVLASVLCTSLELDEISRHDDIFDLGADSLSIQEMLVAIEDRLGVEITVGDLIDAPTVASLAERLSGHPTTRPRDRANAPDEAWFNPDGHLDPIVAIAGAGGATMAFRALAQALGPGQPVLALQQHGIDRGGRVDRTIEAAAQRAEAVLLRRGLYGPLAVVGHSVGGLVAFELARRWIDRGAPVALIGVIDAGPGAEVAPLSGTVDIADRVRATGLRAPLATVSWLAQGLGRRIARSRQLAMAGRRPARTQQDYDRFFEVGLRAARRYDPAPLPVETPLMLVHTVDSTAVGLWDGLAPVAEVEIGGDHLSMLQPPHVGALAEALRERLARA